MSPKTPTHKDHDMHKRDEIEAIYSMLNALETSASDEFQRGVIRTMRALAAHNEHFVNENENFKKAMDLLLEQIFKVQRNA